MVDPRLQAGGQSEVVHGDGEHDDVGGGELVHQRVRQGEGFCFRGAAFFRWEDSAASERFADMRQGFLRHVTHDHFRAGVTRFQVIDDVTRELVRIGLRARAAQDKQNVLHGALLE